jgi:hypothetical protein
MAMTFRGSAIRQKLAGPLTLFVRINMGWAEPAGNDQGGNARIPKGRFPF